MMSTIIMPSSCITVQFKLSVTQKISWLFDSHSLSLSSCYFHRSPGVWQRTPALPKWRGVCQQHPLHLSLSLHGPAVWEVPLRVGAGGLQGRRFRPVLPDAPVLPRATAAAAAGLGAAERGLLLARRALKRPMTLWEWYTPRRLHPTFPSPFQIINNHETRTTMSFLDCTVTSFSAARLNGHSRWR